MAKQSTVNNVRFQQTMKSTLNIFLAIALGNASANQPDSSGLSRFENYRSLVDSGYYFSPGFDCQVTLFAGEIVFSATKKESNWSLFIFKKVSLNVSKSGYEIRQLVGEQIEGEGILCNVSSSRGPDHNREVVSVTRQFGADPDSPGNFTIIISRGKDGEFKNMGCGWSYAPGRPIWKKENLLIEFTTKNKAAVLISSRPNGECFVAD